MKRVAGTALLMCLLVIAVSLMLGLSGARIALQDERAARNERDRKAAFQSAEAALLDAQHDIEQPAGSLRAALFASAAPAFPAGCGAGAANPLQGLCAGPGAQPSWLTVDFLDDGAGSARSVAYGRFTGQTMQVGSATLPARLPRYLIEVHADRRAGAAADLASAGVLYQISAVGFGARDDTRVLLQAWYRRTGGN